MRADDTAPLILLVEDEPEIRGYLEMVLQCEGYEVETAEDGEAALDWVQERGPVSAVLLELFIPKLDGMQLLREIRGIERNLPVIMMSGSVPSSIVVDAMRAGADEFLAKPVTRESLLQALNNVLTSPVPESPKPAEPVRSTTLSFGNSMVMQDLRRMGALVGGSECPVLIRGETGAGKEMLARYLHAHSRRADKPFVKLNCAALPSELVESELFGYERGAFTGAFQRKPGMFEIADRGTLLLDEIGDMDFKLQAKLLQVLQDHEFQRLGGKETVRVDVRVIAATHNDLEKSIAEEKFRQDLFYRLNVVNLYVPPLRERPEDIIPLTEFLLEKHTSPEEPPLAITAELKQALLVHDWPGNVRELENVIRRLIVIRDSSIIARELNGRAARKTLAASPVLEMPGPVKSVPVSRSVLEQVTEAKQQAEVQVILAALNTTRWNRKKASALLKIDYKALLYKMKKLGIDDEAGAANEILDQAGIPASNAND